MDADQEQDGRRSGFWRCRFDEVVLWAIQDGCGRPSRRQYYGARVDFTAWLRRRPTPAEQVALSRSLSRLVRRGLVLRLPGRRVVLTKAGELAAGAGGGQLVAGRSAGRREPDTGDSGMPDWSELEETLDKAYREPSGCGPGTDSRDTSPVAAERPGSAPTAELPPRAQTGANGRQPAGDGAGEEGGGP